MYSRLWKQSREQHVERIDRKSQRHRTLGCIGGEQTRGNNIGEDASCASFREPGDARDLSALEFSADQRFFEKPSGFGLQSSRSARRSCVRRRDKVSSSNRLDMNCTWSSATRRNHRTNSSSALCERFPRPSRSPRLGESASSIIQLVLAATLQDRARVRREMDQSPCAPMPAICAIA